MKQAAHLLIDQRDVALKEAERLEGWHDAFSKVEAMLEAERDAALKEVETLRDELGKALHRHPSLEQAILTWRENFEESERQKDVARIRVRELESALSDYRDCGESLASARAAIETVRRMLKVVEAISG